MKLTIHSKYNDYLTRFIKIIFKKTLKITNSLLDNATSKVSKMKIGVKVNFNFKCIHNYKA